MERANGRKYERCPIGDVDAFASEHWYADGLRGMFRCQSCVATPEDLGYRDPDGDEP